MEISLEESPELVQELADHISITTLPLACGTAAEFALRKAGAGTSPYVDELGLSAAFTIEMYLKSDERAQSGIWGWNKLEFAQPELPCGVLVWNMLECVRSELRRAFGGWDIRHFLPFGFLCCI
jgi:hypothetical protein